MPVDARQLLVDIPVLQKWQSARQPSHSARDAMLKLGTCWDVLRAKELAGIELSDSLSMMPASSVSALVFAHPQANYFAVGKIEKDQVTSYGKRKGYEQEEMEKWLSPILNYDRE